MTTTMQRLDALRNRLTCYEVTAKHPDGREYLIGYLHRTSKRGLFDLIRRRGQWIVVGLGLSEDATFTLSESVSRRPVALIGDWRIGLTGRTERDCISSGERRTLPTS